jgi:hypothetical protein
MDEQEPPGPETAGIERAIRGMDLFDALYAAFTSAGSRP